MAVSWTPSDVLAATGGSSGAQLSQYDSNPHSANSALCAHIYAGKIPSGATIESLYPVCDQFLFLQDALRGAGAVTDQTLLAGIEGLGNSYAPAQGYANVYMGSPNHYDGTSAVRVIEWDSSAQFWHYVSGIIRIPIYNGGP
jgi:hypothetical protein